MNIPLSDPVVQTPEDADEAADAEAIAHGLRGVAFCLAAALLLRSAHVAWSIQRVLAAEAKELM